MTARRQVLAAALALLTAGPAMAQQPAPAPRARPRRAVAAPLPPPPPPPVASRGDPAPVPNHELEAPRRPAAQRATPQLNPALIDPAEPQIGTSRDPSSLQAREDRLLRQPAPGARLRLPFEY